MDLQGYANFLTACANDPRFEAGTLIEAIRKQDPEFSWFTSLAYRFVVVKRVRDGILERAKVNAWFEDRPLQGPGRVDTFNPYKRLFNFDLKADADGRYRRPAATLQSARPPGHVAALGRQQQSGRGKEQERGHRRRRDGVVARSGIARSGRQVGPGSQPAGISIGAHRSEQGRRAERRSIRRRARAATPSAARPSDR